MLGIGNVVTAGSKVASVVRKGLVAWYKGNQIQSPTGEELVSNPDFSLESAPDLLNHSNWYRNTTTPNDNPDDDFILPGDSSTPFDSGQTGITLTDAGFRFKTSGTSTFIAMAQSNIMNSAAANEETLMLTYDILQNSGSGLLYLAMPSADLSLDVSVGPHTLYFTPTTNTFQIKRGAANLDVTIANIKLRKTNPGNKWSVQKLASQDMTCTLTQSSNLITHPSNTNIKVGMKVQGTGVPSSTTITEVNVNGSNTQFRINNVANSNAPATSALRIRAASTVHVKEGEVFIDYVSSDGAGTYTNTHGVSISNIVNHDVGQKYRAEVDVKSISASNKLKVQIGSSPGVYNLVEGLNVFEYVATGQSALYLVRSDDNTSVQAVVTRVSLKKVEASIKDFSSQTNDAELYTGACLNFSGTSENDGIDLGILDSYNIGSGTFNSTSPQLTIATWFKADTLGGKMIFSTGQDGNNRFYLWTQSNKLELGFGNNSGSATNITGGNSVPTLEAGRWYRVVVVLKGPVANLYLDGEYKYSKVSTISFTTEDPLHLGVHGNYSSPHYLDGQISDFQVYESAWESEDVAYDFADPNRDVFERVNATEYLGQNELASKSDSDWIKTPLASGGWSVSNGVLTYDGTLGGNYKAIYIPFDSVPGAEYEVSITMTNHTPQHNGDTQGVNYGIYDYSAGVWTVRPNLNSLGNTTNYQQTRSVNGTHTFRVITNNRRNAVRVQSNNGSATTLGEVSNVTIKRVHHVSVQPTDCLAIYRLNEYYGGRIYNSAPILGEELVNDGGFASDLSNWGSPSNWVYANGGAKKTAAAGSGEKLEQTISGLVNGNLYSISFDLDIETTAGETSIGISNTGAFGHLDETTQRMYQTSGTKKIVGKYVSSGYNNTLKFVGAGDSVFTIDNISVKQIKLPVSQAIVSNGTFGISSVAYDDNTNIVTHSANSMITPGMTVIGDHIEAGTKVLAVSSNTQFTTTRNIQTPGNANLTNQTLTLTKFVSGQPHIPQFGLLNFSKKMVFTDIDTDVDVGAQSIADDQAFSFSFWYAQTDDSSLENYILAKHDSTDDYIRINNQNESLEFKVNGGTAITYNIDDLTDFKISHIVLTRASGADPITKCYVNGILEVTDTSNNAGGVFEYQQIGAGGTSNAGTFFLDELAYFNKELSLTEVQEIFNSGMALDVRDHSKYLGSELITDNIWAFQSVGPNNTINGITSVGSYQSSDGSFRFITESSGSSPIDIKKSSLIEADHYYELSYDITSSNHNTGLATYTALPGGSGATQQTLDTTVGSHKMNFYSKNTFLIIKRTQPGIDVTISNISLKKINLCGYWRNNGAETWADLSVHNHDGTVNGSPNNIYLQELPLLKKDVFGFPMNRVRRNGLNLEFGAAIADPAPVRTNTDAITVEAWVYPRQIGATDQAVVGTRDNNSYLLYRQRNSNYFRFYVNGGQPSDNMAAETSHLDFNKWYHIVGVYDKTRSKEFNIYVNGESNNVHLSSSQDSEGFCNPSNGELNESVEVTETELYLGKYANANFHGGIIDDVKIYDRRLSLSEIKRNYNATKGAHKNLSITWSDDFSENFG